MKHKDYEPIKFEFFQSDMEKIMLHLKVLRGIMLRLNPNKYEQEINTTTQILEDILHKKECHKERGEWFGV